MYYVWQRNDGHVDATCYKPNDYAIQTRDEEQQLADKLSGKDKVSFSHLGQFEEWDEALECIRKIRLTLASK